RYLAKITHKDIEGAEKMSPREAALALQGLEVRGKCYEMINDQDDAIVSFNLAVEVATKVYNAFTSIQNDKKRETTKVIERVLIKVPELYLAKRCGPPMGSVARAVRLIRNRDVPKAIESFRRAARFPSLHNERHKWYRQFATVLTFQTAAAEYVAPNFK